MSTRNRFLCGPFQKPGIISKTATGGRTSRVICTAVSQRSLGSALERPRPAAEVLWHCSPTQTEDLDALPVLVHGQRYPVLQERRGGSEGPKLACAKLGRRRLLT
eukprot:11486847-Alexandrium_andersonii.AAC.1